MTQPEGQPIPASPTDVTGTKLLDAVLRSLAVGLYTIDLTGRLTYINPVGERLLGHAGGALVGREVHEAIHFRHEDGRPFPAAECPLIEVLHAGPPQHGATVFWRADGEPLHVRYSSAAIFDDEGRRAGAALTFLDVSEEQRRGAAAAAAERNLARASREADELREERRRLLELERVKGEFLNLAAHELRGPLSVALGYVSMLGDGTFGPPEAADVRTALPVVSGKLREMSTLVDQMLDIARLEEGRLEVEPVTLDVREVVHNVLRIMSPLSRRHRLVVLWSGTPAIVRADPSRVTTILTNLVDNACKYSAAGTTIEIAVVPADCEVVVSVRDQGIGIAAEDMHRVFQRFGRIVTRENSHIAGVGLGLYLSRNLARLQGGDITFESSPGKGSVFSLRLPAAVTATQPLDAVRAGTNTEGST